MMTTGEIRRTFLDYFRKNDHEIVPSSSLVPHNDPTLMFTNSGMVQFKNIFTGMENARMSAPHRIKSVCAPAESTTIWITSVIPCAIIRF